MVAIVFYRKGYKNLMLVLFYYPFSIFFVKKKMGEKNWVGTISIITASQNMLLEPWIGIGIFTDYPLT